MEKHVTELYCDRCRGKFHRRESGFVTTATLVIGWLKLRNGSGSKSVSQGRTWENLDYDLCSNCTEEFDVWWKSPPKRDVA